jgi:hypothetical protein
MFEFRHISSDNLFHKRQPFTENELSGASTPTSGIRNLNLCALVILLLASLTNFIKSNKYTIDYNIECQSIPNFMNRGEITFIFNEFWMSQIKRRPASTQSPTDKF